MGLTSRRSVKTIVSSAEFHRVRTFRRVPAAAVATQAKSELVDEVAAAIAAHKVVVVGVFGLQPGRRARKLLDEKKVAYCPTISRRAAARA